MLLIRGWFQYAVCHATHFQALSLLPNTQWLQGTQALRGGIGNVFRGLKFY